jgi:hypothetical protein
MRSLTWIGKLLLATTATAADPATLLYDAPWTVADYGQLPDGWTDRVARRPSRGWIIDGYGFLRPTLKRAIGLVTYDGYLTTTKPARQLADVEITADFKKTADAEESFGLAARVQDRDDYYLARLIGDQELQLVAVVAGQKTVLARETTLARYRDGAIWRLVFTVRGDASTARLYDHDGREMARVDAVDARFAKGPPGVCATPYAAARSFRLSAVEPIATTYDAEGIAKRNARLVGDEPVYAVVGPTWDFSGLNTPPDRVAREYDVVVAGAGTGGFAAALQAARLGASVLLIDETDWIGGQAAAAAVTSMDEDGVYGTYPVRERGIYREFHESMVAYYRTLDKDPFVAYYGNPQQEGGYEPKVVRAVLYGLIAETRGRKPKGDSPPVLDLCLRTRVASVHKDGNRVIGVSVEHDDDNGGRLEEVACRVLVDATEYGDVLPLAGVRYRVSNGFGGEVAPTSPIQDHTWLAVVKEYPDGVPEHLQLHAPPPGYEAYAAKRFRKFQHHGVQAWGPAAKETKGPRDWRVYFAWRGMADTESPLVGRMSELRHTQCGFNGGNDYPVTAATCEDLDQRQRDEKFGIERTLGTLYYFQHELGLDWSVADDEGFDTPSNRAKMKSLGLRLDLESLAVHLPQLPYVRESRRMVGVATLRAADLTRYAEAKHVATSIAMGDYFMDLDHGRTGQLVEADLDVGVAPHGGGPFQVPFEVLIPETLDGFLAAEKNFSQSRLANGATRLQPITMLTGQAVGTIAALAAKQRKQPRELHPLEAQRVLLDSGSTLIQRWYADVPWGTPIWRATQLLSLYQVLDRPGPIDQDAGIPLGSRSRWGVDEPIAAQDVRSALVRLATLHGISISPLALPSDDRPVDAEELGSALTGISPQWGSALEARAFADPAAVAGGEFALLAAELLLKSVTASR